MTFPEPSTTSKGINKKQKQENTKHNEGGGSSSSKKGLAVLYKDWNCSCGIQLRSGNKDGSDWMSCAAQQKVAGKYVLGCKVFINNKSIKTIPKCVKHKTFVCPCKDSAEVTEYKRQKIKCYCGDLAAVYTTKTKSPNYVFLTCRRKQKVNNEYVSECMFWCRADEYDELEDCPTCARKMTRAACICGYIKKDDICYLSDMSSDDDIEGSQYNMD